jgi:iron complex outermembrane recepter protein
MVALALLLVTAGMAYGQPTEPVAAGDAGVAPTAPIADAGSADVSRADPDAASPQAPPAAAAAVDGGSAGDGGVSVDGGASEDGGLASAAPAAAEPSTQLENVIVTAEHHETNQQRTPIAITTFGTRELQDRGVNSLRDLAGQVPNLSIARANISYTTQTYALRGIGETDPIQEPVVAIYVDDVYQPRQIGSMPDFNDIERVEVLRGPQGTLYGRNTNAGAIRVISADPSNDFHTQESLTYGNFNAVKALSSVSGPIVRDKLYASVAFLENRRDGIDSDPTLQTDVNRIAVSSGRLKLRWTPAQDWDVLATLNGMVDRSDSRSYIPADQPGVSAACRATTTPWKCPGFSPTTSYSGLQPYQKLNQISGSIRAIYKATKELNVKLVSSLGGFDLNPVWYDNDGVAALIQQNLIHYDDGYHTDEIELNGDYKRVNFTGGLFYLHERFFVQRDGYSRKNALPTDPDTDPGNYAFLRAHNITYTNSYAAFGQANLKVTDALTLTGGIRETVEEKAFNFHNYVLNVNGLVTAPSIIGDANHTWSALAPKAALSVQWTPELLNYVTYSRGFRAGGFDNRATNITLAERGFSPEYVDNYEAGLKSDWLDHHLRANAAAFYDNYTDLQVSYTDPAYPGNSIRGNAGKAVSEGAEVETEARLPFGLSLQASGGYLYANYKTYDNCNGIGVDCGGHPLINAPRWNFSGGGTLDIPVPVPGYVRLAGDVEWASEAFSTALSRAQDEYPAQTFVNGTLSWTSESDRIVATLSSRNLLNSQKPVSTSFTPSTGVLFYNFADPRTVLFTLKYQD